jgi:CheY-like chemotaxis protein
MAIVLTDIMMPVMDGAVMVATLRRIDPSIPVVALSGAPTVETRAKLGALGVHKFLPKPLNASALMHAVHAALQPAAAGMN